MNRDLNAKVGVLSEDSIYKRLHSHILSKELTLPMHSAQNIESSLHDWFYYGRDVFEDRRDKLKKVAEMCEITHLCPALDVSYDKRVAHWRHKYLGEPLEEEEAVVLEMQCGDLFVGTFDYADHCIGTYWDPFFWWEHKVADLSLLCYPLLWFLMSKGYTFKVGFPKKEWIYLLLLLTNGFATWKAIVFLCISSLFWVYVPYFIGREYYKNVIVPLLEC